MIAGKGVLEHRDLRHRQGIAIPDCPGSGKHESCQVLDIAEMMIKAATLIINSLSYLVSIHTDTSILANTSANGTDGSPYFANTRSRAPMLSTLDNEIALTASAYANWRTSHRFCTQCGSPVEYVQGGTCAKCTRSGHTSWPRQDPSIIVLVTNADSTHALLARSPRHPSYLYTALAGFVEPGENMESAVAREVHEEVGVNVNPQSTIYISSQAWPFPQSCMIGFHAKTHSAAGLASISIDPKELVDARWFEKEEVYQAARDTDVMGAVLDRQVVEAHQANGKWTGNLLVPSKGVLARTLVDHWLEE